MRKLTIRVLVVEDSLFMRRVISDAIGSMEGIEVADTAQNGVFALSKLKTSKPDIITLDIEMPVMDGLETIKKIREVSSVPIIMLSAMDDQETTIHALEIGAQDFITKPENISQNKEEFTESLESNIRALVDQPVKKVKTSSRKKESIVVGTRPTKIDALMIGASTGGPNVLTKIVSSLPANLSIPVFIVQHMPEGFTASFAKRMDSLADVPVVEAENRMLVKPGTVYLAQGGKHMVVRNKRIQLLDTEKIHSVKPAVDPLFESVVDHHGGNTLGVILTGMGRDGAAGCLDIKRAGGYVIAQNEESCVVYGMPRHAYEAGAVNELLSIEEIIETINEIVRV